MESKAKVVPGPLRTCRLCSGAVESPQARKCVGLGLYVALLVPGSSVEEAIRTVKMWGLPELDPDVAEASVDDHGARVWCQTCGQKVLERRRTPVPTGDDVCQLSREKFGVVIPGCTIVIPTKGGNHFLCSNCTQHIIGRESEEAEKKS